jgi:subtilisin family serine protease
MPDFPHLKLPFKVEGSAKPFGGGGKKDPNSTAITNRNKENRQQHGQFLSNSADTLINKWEEIKKGKQEKGIGIPNEKDIPVFLKIDTSSFDVDSLRHWGIEVISEEQDGFIIGASIDGLKSFKDNINQFLGQDGRYKDKAAQIWEFITDDSWRVSQLLKGEISKIWSTLNDNTIYIVELGVSCNVTNTKEFPNKNKFDTEAKYQQAIEDFKINEQEVQVARDQKQIIREEEIEKYIESYGATLQGIWDIGTDAIFFKISIIGAGLKDIVHNYQYLFEVKLDSAYSLTTTNENIEVSLELEVIAPNNNATTVCVIDSGIQESHRLIAAAIDSPNSRSYVDGDASVTDYVTGSGHGTKVAGAILYPNSIPKTGQYQLESKIQNARILDRDNRISENKFAPALLEQIKQDYPETRIFNLSVADDAAYIGTHMPSLAASIDKLSHEYNILFIVAAGNLYESSDAVNNPGIKEYIKSGQNYPHYFNNDYAKIASPGVSFFAITVGSVSAADFEDDDYKAIAGKGFISPFSRVGLGMWGSMKPDVVEFGGDLAKNKLSPELIKKEELLPELVQSTMHGASAIGNYSYGTSYSTPKVSYIASKLQAEHPNETAQMYRALIIQSARLPDHCFNNPTLNDFRHYGYGVPNVNRALNNTTNRITFIQNGNVGPKKADIYHLKIPDELRGEGRDFRILVEVTLSFTAKTRITRKGAHSYLSNWIEWQSSKYNERFSSFRNRTIDYLDLDESIIEAGEIEEGLNAIKWCIRENPSWTNNGINRNKSTVQKSWATIDPHQFADEFSLAVIGHVGWDKNLENQVPYALCVSFEALDTEMNIYNILAEAQVEVEQNQLEIEF